MLSVVPSRIPLSAAGAPILKEGPQPGTVFNVSQPMQMFDGARKRRVIVGVRLTAPPYAGCELSAFYTLHVDDDGELFVPAGMSSAARKVTAACLGYVTTDFQRLKGLDVMAHIKTVTTDKQRLPQPKSLHYSKIAMLWRDDA